jgi:hypothetical protein
MSGGSLIVGSAFRAGHYASAADVARRTGLWWSVEDEGATRGNRGEWSRLGYRDRRDARESGFSNSQGWGGRSSGVRHARICVSASVAPMRVLLAAVASLALCGLVHAQTSDSPGEVQTLTLPYPLTGLGGAPPGEDRSWHLLQKQYDAWASGRLDHNIR